MNLLKTALLHATLAAVAAVLALGASLTIAAGPSQAEAVASAVTVSAEQA